MGAAHTPGPWTAHLSATRKTLCVTAPDAWVCGELHNRESMSDDEAWANARLIAAAPELLEALRAAESAMAYVTTVVGQHLDPAEGADLTARRMAARAAIAKATGAS